MHGSALKDGNVQSSAHMIRAIRAEGADADVSVIGLQTESREVPSGGCFSRKVRSSHLSHRSLVIGSGRISALQAFLQAWSDEGRIRRLITQGKLLAWGEPDDAGQTEHLLSEIVARHNQLLLPGLELNLCAQSVNGGRYSRSLLVGSFVVKRLRCPDLGVCCIHSGSTRDCL